jgi:S-adenosylmethionine synthetase
MATPRIGDSMKYQFTSESVSEGHPDKVADRISDTIANYLLREKNYNRAAVETLVTTNRVILAGEYKTDLQTEERVMRDHIDYLVRQVVKDIGYEQDGFHWKNLTVENYLHGQSSDIALGTDDFGAGDQGLMFGFATRENGAYMPAPIHCAHEILKELTRRRKEDEFYHDILPDSKAQVTFNYEDGVPVDIDTILVSTQHKEETVSVEARVFDVITEVIDPKYLTDDTKYLINPTGRFVIGGPDGDTGLTGRKIIVDTYGGAAPHGGGAFSGKDGSKVDRTGAYMARFIAKNLVARNEEYNTALVQLSYAIGVKEPTSVCVWTDGKPNSIVSQWVKEKYDLTPLGMIERLQVNSSRNLLNSTNYGHFGDKDVSWEEIDV